ncbi:Acyltransferase [Acidipropionibacterium acidipropionici ATCC 4875]|uniref:Acyltransferase n=1 Tax=Acidipropionibacterium acidipropionici (strain ATCC 4875 / DSM 20272 / JCM 6432 / NBRC 12425 / NCIMB 8070 / 4) TaxID=1171373 RepID=K7RNC2_ACIA4|nr:acyltransferase [Acidipropionibacterium acidipropionici]AFV89464.1 Acyltransferase [Acidipropionibacterium acidipropionici ATCC 4875]ALN16072.1 hypothetical protein ASQ49_13260 [Acidipropionibacterium acidipropionici]APZ08179.1 hypothetical protein BWX38_01625 [Acidipropionibacterium acidipropionici]
MGSPEQLRDGLQAGAIAGLRYCPRALWQPASRAAGALMGAHPAPPVRQWMLNAEVMTGSRPSAGQVRAAVVSWARTQVVSMQLPRWSPGRIAAAVSWDPAALDLLRTAAGSRGAVVALPHMGSWDLAGAWVAGQGLPVTTVAERLPDPQFDLFVRTRNRLGMRVHANTETGVMRHLLDDVSSGRLVCLVADRDLSGSGIATHWRTARGAVDGRIPPGPAHLAVLTGAALIGAACHYTDPTHMRIDFSPVLEPPPTGSSRRRAGALTDRLAEWFSMRIRDHVLDWHMFQPFFDGVRP